jgi:deoxyribodipyrimidine photo-lyase
MGVSSPLLRLRDCNDAPVLADRDYVLYWMIGARRVQWNFALDRACDWAGTLGKPLLIFEPLRIDYPWASVRMHRFVLQGMAENAAACAARGVTCHPYVEPGPHHAQGLLQALAEHACLIVTDDVPAFFQPRMVATAARRVPCLMECVDGWGLLPLRATGVPYTTAYQFRRFLQRELPVHLGAAPRADPLRGYYGGLARVPESIVSEWPAAPAERRRDAHALAELPVRADVPPAPIEGGQRAALRQLRRFLRHGLDTYQETGNALQPDASSGLSPWLHFGHIGVHQVFTAIARHENWSIEELGEQATGKRDGWWGMRAGAEAFLDELITWRELAANSALYLDAYDEYRSLPDWARATLKKHRRDRRPALYTLDEFRAAGTHDALWNAAQRQLLLDGTIHRYLRMLWGKLILEWSAEPEQAFEIMVELNNRYAVDGRDANSWGGISWVLGRYDHPWPERAIYGKVRSMTSRSTARKLDVREYLEEYGHD